MADDKGYKVVNVEELTVLQTVSSLKQPDGSTVYQNGMGRTYLEGEIIPAELVAEDWKEALDSGEGDLYEALKDRLEPASTSEGGENIAARLGLPFEDYDSMDEEDVLKVMNVLPSGVVRKIQEYEAMRDEPRRTIVDYNIGFGESPEARQQTELEQNDGDENKAAARLTTRQVPEDGPVVPGEGFTGTGDPDKPYGVEKDAEAGDEQAQVARVASKGRGNVAEAKARRGRRDRSRQPQPPPGAGEGGTSLESQND
jgi:hypothetical protein